MNKKINELFKILEKLKLKIADYESILKKGNLITYMYKVKLEHDYKKLKFDIKKLAKRWLTTAQ